MATVSYTKKQQSNINKYASDSVKKAFGYNASTGTSNATSSATPSRSSGGSSRNSYNDVIVVTEENVNKPEEGITKVSLVDSNSGRTIRTLKANESINFTQGSSSAGLNANEMRMSGEAGRQLKAGTFGQTPNVLTNQIQKYNTISILESTQGKASVLEYQGKSYSPEGFQKEFGVKVLYDPTKKDYFFGTVGVPEKEKVRLPSSMNAGFTPITKEERKQVSKALLKANVLVVASSFNKKVVQTGKDYLYENITAKTSEKLSKTAEAIKARATYTLNNSDFKTGNKAIDLTTKSLGGISYFVGSAGAYGLNMISGLGNLALGLTLKTEETTKQIVMSAPSMLKASFTEIGKTVTGQGTIEDFFGAALTLTAVAQTTSSFAKLGKIGRDARTLGRDAGAIRSAVKESEKLLKSKSVYFQKVFVKNQNKWATFGKAQQAMKSMNAKHSWVSLTEGKVSAIIQKSVIENRNIKMTVYMGAQSTTEKLFKFMGLVNNRKLGFIESFTNTKKISTYLSKVRTKPMYTFVEKKGANYISAFDGAGNVKILRSQAEVREFMRTATFGKFRFTGNRLMGGNIEKLWNIGKNKYIGSEAFSTKKSLGVKNGEIGVGTEKLSKQTAFKKTIGGTVVKKYVDKAKQGALGKSYFRGERGSKKFRTIDNGNGQKLIQKQSQKTTQINSEIGLSKQVGSSVVSSQLKNVVKAIDKAIGDNKVALRNGYTAVVGRSGLMFLSKNGGIVSARVATTATTSQVDRVQNKVKQIVANASSNKSASEQKSAQKQGVAQQSAQRSQQEQRQQQMQRQGTNTARARANVNMKVKERIRVVMPSNEGDKNPIVRKILGNKIAPSYEIYLESKGKRVRKVSGRYSAKDAISKGAYTVDGTQQRTVRIVPTKQKPNARFKRDYLSEAGKKFRNYRYKQGKKVSYSSSRLIEKRKYFNDIRGETPRKRRNERREK